MNTNVFNFTPITGLWHARIIGSDLNGTKQGYYKEFVNADLTNGVISLIHNLNKRSPTVSAYNDVNELIMPDNVVYVNENRVDLNVLSYVAITGTWSARVSYS